LCVGINGQAQIVTSTDPTGGDTAWTAVDQQSSLFGPSRAISCPSQQLCVVVGSTGAVLYSTEPAGGAGAWHTAAHLPASRYGIAALSCPSTTLCVAADASGTVFTTNDPTQPDQWSSTPLESGSYLTGLSCSPPSFCVSSSGSSVYVSADALAGSWSSMVVDTVDSQYENQIQSVACPSTQLCIAADREGNVAGSSDPASPSASWQLGLVDAVPVPDDISCGPGSVCVAVDSGGNILTSSNPVAGAASWHPLHVSGNALTWVGCYPEDLCVTALSGGLLASADPLDAAAWAGAPIAGPTVPAQCPTTSFCVDLEGALAPPTTFAISVGPLSPQRPVVLTGSGNEWMSMHAVSCPSAAFCVGLVTARRLVGDVWWPQRELIAISTNPASRRAWTIDSTPAPELNAVACPSPTLCIGTIADGKVAATTDPSGGTRTWKTSTAPAGKTLTWITCPSEWLCVLSDATGDLLTRTNPGTDAASWTIQHVAYSIERPSCISTSLCVALNQQGQVVVGTGTPGSYQDGVAAASRAIPTPAGPRVAVACNGGRSDRCRLRLVLTFLRHRARASSTAGARFSDLRARRRALIRVTLTAAARRQLLTFRTLRLKLTITATARTRARIVSTQVVKLTAEPRR
jgi:hypothetical protein